MTGFKFNEIGIFIKGRNLDKSIYIERRWCEYES